MAVISEKYNDVNVIVWFAVAVAALNWGLVGAADINLVEMVVVDTLSMDQSALDLVYVGIGAIGAYDILETLGKIN